MSPDAFPPSDWLVERPHELYVDNSALRHTHNGTLASAQEAARLLSKQHRAGVTVRTGNEFVLYLNTANSEPLTP